MWSTDASQSSAGHPGFHVAPEATLFHWLAHAGMKIAPKYQQNSCDKKDRRQQNGKSYFHPANMPSVSGIFQPEVRHTASSGTVRKAQPGMTTFSKRFMRVTGLFTSAS
jgi:hypothetical protein